MKRIDRASSMTAILMNGEYHVIVACNDRSKYNYPNANYANEGAGLAGILKPRQSLESFKENWINSNTNKN